MPHACYVCNFEPVPDGEGVECPHCHRLQYGKVCPFCGREAPTLIRGTMVYCSACNRVRGPLAAGMGPDEAGRPSASFARALGWSAILAGALFGMAAWFLGGLLDAGVIGFVLGLVVAAAGAVAGGLMLSGGRKLRQQEASSQALERERALFSLAAQRGGSLTATDVATALGIPVAEADALLTKLARGGTHVSVEVDGSGVVHYVFNEVRVASQSSSAGEPTGVRVEAGAAPSRESTAEGDSVKARVDREWERLQKGRRA